MLHGSRQFQGCPVSTREISEDEQASDGRGAPLKLSDFHQQIFGSTSLEVASSYLELAQANLKKKDFNEAINFQQKALKVFSEVDQQTVSQDMVADTAITLSEWLEKVERIEEALDVLKQAE